MSAFDNHRSPKAIEAFEEQLKKQQEIEEDVAILLNTMGAECVETRDVSALIDEIERMVYSGYNALSDLLKKHIGRPVIKWDIRTFRKDDAYGSLHELSKKLVSPRPIVIIENITDIPEGDPCCYDDPRLVENLMLHSWKNEVNSYDVPKFGHYELRSQDYTVILPWNVRDKEKIMKLWRPSDGLAWIEKY